MVKRIVGYDAQGKKVFDREARSYDNSVENRVFGVSVGDVIKAVPVIFLCGMIWQNQQITNKTLFNSLSENNKSIQELTRSNGATLEFLNKYISRMDNYLSATTGKRFKEGEPQ